MQQIASMLKTSGQLEKEKEKFTKKFQRRFGILPEVYEIQKNNLDIPEEDSA